MIADTIADTKSPPDFTNLTPEQKSHLDYIWALSIIATRQIPTEISPETASGHVGGKPYQLTAMNNSTANPDTQPPTPGDASRYRFLRTAMWWREVKAMRRTQAIITFPIIDDDHVDEEFEQLATEIETAKNVLVHRCLFGTWTVIEDVDSNSGHIVSALTDKEKMMVLEMQDYLNNLGAYKAIQIAAPEITKLASMYMPTMPQSVPTPNNDQLNKVISELMQESVNVMDQEQKAELLARAKPDNQPDHICASCNKPCSEVPYYCMNCGLDWSKWGGISEPIKEGSPYHEPTKATQAAPVVLAQPQAPPTLKSPSQTFDSVVMNPPYDPAFHSAPNAEEEIGWV